MIELIGDKMQKKEDKFLISNVEDKISSVREYEYCESTGFLDMHEQSILKNYFNKLYDLNFLFYGAYEDAERKILFIFPKYIENIDYSEFISLLEIENLTSFSLGHRDYLGALMGLGLKRDCVGDIHILEKKAQIILLKDVSDFLLNNLNKVGNCDVILRRIELDKIKIINKEREELKASSSSLRIDSVVATCFNLPRSKVQEYINMERVFLNSVAIKKNEKQVSDNDYITLRGFGKIKLISVKDLSKKNRNIIKYIKM